MTNQIYPSDLSDSQWNLLTDLLSPAKPGGRRRAPEMRHVFNAIVSLLVTGI